MTQKQKILTVYWVTFFGSLIWVAAIVMAPLMTSLDNGWGVLLYKTFSPLCHQIPERCFHLWGFPLAVCSRCFGIYSGFITGLLLFPITKRFSSVSVPKTSFFILMTTPILTDTIGNFFLLWKTSTWLRFAIGWIWGIILPFYFVAGISEAWIRHGEYKHFNS
jgi:uncharacterized membrane protein